VSCRLLLPGGAEQLRSWAMPSGDVQQCDRACERVAVPVVRGGYVLRRDGAGVAERGVPGGVLLQRGVGGGERERVRPTGCDVRQSELRFVVGGCSDAEVWRRVSGRVVLSGGVRVADAVPGGAVLQCDWSGERERGLRSRVLLSGAEQHEPEGCGLPRGTLLPGGDGGACEVSAGDVP
jgi:hypothetical protein